MTITEAIQELKEYNKWRRGDESIPQPNPTIIGIAIDRAISYYEKNKTKKPKKRSP